jgi:hypothetical protein
MVICFSGALCTGWATSLKQSYPIFPFSHLLLACIGFSAFFLHGFQQILGDPIGDYLILGVFLTSVAIYALFIFVSKMRQLGVNHHLSYFGDLENPQYMFLVVEYANSNTVPPGSFFMIYSNANSSISLFHGHPFPVFSSRDRKLTFLIQCRSTHEGSNRASFTTKLAMDLYPTNTSCSLVISFSHFSRFSQYPFSHSLIRPFSRSLILFFSFPSFLSFLSLYVVLCFSSLNYL